MLRCAVRIFFVEVADIARSSVIDQSSTSKNSDLYPPLLLDSEESREMSSCNVGRGLLRQ